MRTLACLVALLPALYCLASDDLADPDWSMYRHDTWLSGHSPLKGAITTPKLAWESYLGAWDNLLVASFEPDANGSVALRNRGLDPGYLAANARLWGLGPVEKDLAGDGKLIPVASEGYTRYARIVPGSKGIQKIHNDDYFGTGTPYQRKLYAYDFRPGDPTPHPLWESGPYGELEGMTMLVLDVDNDGRPEIVGDTWGRIFAWDGETGKQKMFLQWHEPKRDYGFFAAVKMTPDNPYPQFVCIGDFVTHIDVVGNDGKSFKVLWSKDVESQLGGKYKACRPLVNSALDIDGDGNCEVVANLFNDTGDKRWHFMVYEGMTGKVKLDAPDVYVYAAQDIDGDGVPELFCGSVSEGLICDPGQLSVANVRSSRLETRLSSPEPGMFEFVDVKDLPLDMDTMAANGRRTVRLADVDGDGFPEFFVRTEAGVAAWGASKGGHFARKGTIGGPELSIVGAGDVDAGKREKLLLRATVGDGEKGAVKASGAALKPVACVSRAPAISPPVVVNGQIVVPDALNRIVALQGPGGGSAPKRLWAVPGRAISADAGTYYGVVAADLDGDGAKEIVFGRPGPGGEAQIVALKPGTGAAGPKELWVNTFPAFCGRTPVWNFNGLTHWSVGRYTGRQGFEVAVSLRRSSMHTDETHLLDGRTGKEVWANPYSKAASETEYRGFGGALTASLDVDGDGCEDILCEYPDEYYVASGKTGKLTLSKWGLDIFPGGWLAYATPIVGRFLEGGKLGLMWTQGGYRRGVMTLQGEKVWAFDYMDGYGPMPGVGDVNGDGKLEGLSAQKAGTTCFDTATGAIRWTMPAYGQSSDCVTADINGDGKDEFIFGSGKKLVAVNEVDGKPNVVWELDMPAACGPPAIADVNGDGKAEVVVMTNDGWVRVVE